jgi:hypothetical protein
VETTAEHSLTTRINAAIGRQVRSRAAAAASYYSLGGQDRLHALFAEAMSRFLTKATASTSLRSMLTSSQSS